MIVALESMCSTWLLIIVGFVIGGVQVETSDINRTDDSKLSLVMACALRMVEVVQGYFALECVVAARPGYQSAIHFLRCVYHEVFISLTMFAFPYAG